MTESGKDEDRKFSPVTIDGLWTSIGSPRNLKEKLKNKKETEFHFQNALL
jgi:hypothetical protein